MVKAHSRFTIGRAGWAGLRPSHSFVLSPASTGRIMRPQIVFLVLLLAPACAFAPTLTLAPHRKGPLSGLSSAAAPLRTPRSWPHALPLQPRETRRAAAMAQTRMSASVAEPESLRTMFSPPWACMAGCGACCRLAPEERSLENMSDDDRALYVSMAGEDGWCVHFDKETRLCGQFEDRPGFCRIENLGPMYGVEDEEEVCCMPARDPS